MVLPMKLKKPEKLKLIFSLLPWVAFICDLYRPTVYKTVAWSLSQRKSDINRSVRTNFSIMIWRMQN